jgi:protein phosphatase
VPLHILAGGSSTFFERDHVWHMTALARLADVAPALFRATLFRVVDVASAASQAEGAAWWAACE